MRLELRFITTEVYGSNELRIESTVTERLCKGIRKLMTCICRSSTVAREIVKERDIKIEGRGGRESKKTISKVSLSQARIT